jgi:hypothetical protein
MTSRHGICGWAARKVARLTVRRKFWALRDKSKVLVDIGD